MDPKDLETFDLNEALRNLENRKRTSVREMLSAIVECAVYMGVAAGLCYLAFGLWSWARSSPEDVLLIVAVVIAGGILWCLFVATAETLAVITWATIAWAGYAIGAALGGIVVGIAGTILVGVTVAPLVANIVFAIAHEIRD